MVLTTIGKSAPRQKSARMHCHTDWELIYNISGSGIMTVNGKDYAFGPDTILLCPPGVWHDKRPEEGFKDIYMRFLDWDQLTDVFCLETGGDRRLLQLLEVLHSSYFEKGTEQVCNALCDAILGLLRPLLTGEGENPYVKTLRSCIIDRFADPDFSVGEAMGEIPINKDHLRRLFAAQTGFTPQGYLTHLRIEKAKRLLREGRGVAEVAYRCGYYDPLYFSRIFGKATGVSPSQWQKEVKNGV